MQVAEGVARPRGQVVACLSPGAHVSRAPDRDTDAVGRGEGTENRGRGDAAPRPPVYRVFASKQRAVEAIGQARNAGVHQTLSLIQRSQPNIV